MSLSSLGDNGTSLSDHYKNFYNLFKKNTPPDINLVTDDGVQLAAHKLILASASSWFEVLFYGGFKKNNQSNVTVNEIESDVLRSILTYVYTFKLDIKDNNIEKLLKAADCYQFNNVKKLCYDFIKEKMNNSNCMTFLKYANPISHKELHNFCFHYILMNFENLILNSEFGLDRLYESNFDDFVEFISNDYLDIESEEVVFELIIGWINYNLYERKDCLPELLKYLRLPLIPKHKLKRITTERLVKRNKDYLVDFLKEIDNIRADLNISNATQRPPYAHVSNIIFAIKGVSGDEDGYIKYLDLRDEENLNWKFCDFSFFRPRRYCSVLVFSSKGVIFAIGGFEEPNKWTNHVDALDLSSTAKNWVSVTPMKTVRRNFAVSVHGNFIFVIGGEDKHRNTLASVEYYDTEFKVWKKLPKSMPTPRKYCKSIIHNNCLFVFGGINDKMMLKSVDCYNLKNKRWITLGSMPAPKCSMAMAVGKNVLYLIGGGLGIFPYSSEKSVFKFDLKNHKWTVLPEMNEPRFNANGVLIKNDLFVFGGVQFDEPKPTVASLSEKYNSDKKEWKFTKSANVLFAYNHAFCLNDMKLKAFGINI
ncbi:kelch-like protein 12 [Adelges cooleyi]|uniref:kelch-like protein 12 n=1 Tax=Adelges cooleyi TaxID=133065 RepID=UPI00217F6C89|nr:kelch-like protein 12 [Adelges cooleyi]XP_050431020.1 kelch-like protein 12 [Adelges cooleyi]